MPNQNTNINYNKYYKLSNNLFALQKYNSNLQNIQEKLNTYFDIKLFKEYFTKQNNNYLLEYNIFINLHTNTNYNTTTNYNTITNNMLNIKHIKDNIKKENIKSKIKSKIEGNIEEKIIKIIISTIL